MTGTHDDPYDVDIDGETITVYSGGESRMRALALAEGAFIAGAESVEITNGAEKQRRES